MASPLSPVDGSQVRWHNADYGALFLDVSAPASPARSAPSAAPEPDTFTVTAPAPGHIAGTVTDRGRRPRGRRHGPTRSTTRGPAVISGDLTDGTGQLRHPGPGAGRVRRRRARPTAVNAFEYAQDDRIDPPTTSLLVALGP